MCSCQAVSELAAMAMALAGLLCHHALKYSTTLATPMAKVIVLAEAVTLGVA